MNHIAFYLVIVVYLFNNIQKKNKLYDLNNFKLIVQFN